MDTVAQAHKKADKIIKDYEMMSPAWQEAMMERESEEYREYVWAKEWQVTDQKFAQELHVIQNTRKAATMLLLLSLLGRYGRTMFV
jgi:hypothetical protein